MESNDKNNQMLDSGILNKLQFKIYLLERDNHKTKKFTESEMVNKIRKIIDEMVRSEDNV